MEGPWTVYRTRFVVRACQLTEPLSFTDALGREHSGLPGDYLVETSPGFRRITSRALFEDIYVPLKDPLTPGPEAPRLSIKRPANLADLDGSVRHLSSSERRPQIAAWSG